MTTGVEILRGHGLRCAVERGLQMEASLFYDGGRSNYREEAALLIFAAYDVRAEVRAGGPTFLL